MKVETKCSSQLTHKITHSMSFVHSFYIFSTLSSYSHNNTHPLIKPLETLSRKHEEREREE